jgi:hypothetical protein
MINPQWEYKQLTCGEIKKGDLISILVKESKGVNGITDLLEVQKTGFTSMRSVIRYIYDSLPTYKGKCLYIKVVNTNNGKFIISNSHRYREEVIPRAL